MKTIKYTLEQGDMMECPFQGLFDNDLWVAFHGTSNHVEEQIDKEGFLWKKSPYTRSEIDTVLNVFKKLHWAGSIKDGYLVLATYTQYDFNSSSSGKSKPISFAVISQKSLLYASQVRAGGETTSALRYAFEDLNNYLNNIEFRQKQLWKLWHHLKDSIQGLHIPKSYYPASKEKIQFAHVKSLWDYYQHNGIKKIMSPAGGYLSEPIEFSTKWLNKEIQKLQAIRNRCNYYYETFTHGVVYAVKLFENDLPYLKYGSNITANMPISPKRILAKSIIPKGFISDPIFPTGERMFRLFQEDSAMNRIQKMQKTKS